MAEPSTSSSEVAKQAEQQAERSRRMANWSTVRGHMGLRYSRCDLETFQAMAPQHRDALNAVTNYTAEWPQRLAEGRGMLLFGPTGTGKDHLAAAALKVVVRDHGATAAWTDGQELFSLMRDKMSTDASESGSLGPYLSADALVISDPLPAEGKPTDYQQSLLWLIINRRYRNLKPTWLTCNVATSRELRDRLGTQLADRILDSSLCVFCNWASYRKPSEVVK